MELSNEENENSSGCFTHAAGFKAMSESVDLIDGDRIKSMGTLI